MRGRLDDRGRVAGRDHRPQRALEHRRLRASSRASGFGSGRRRSGSPAVPIMPVRRPAASSAATARNDVVVLPSVPVIPTTAELAARVAVPPRGGARRARPASRSTTSWGSGDLGQRPLDDRGRGAPRCRGRATNSWPSTCWPGTATNSAPGRDRPRVVGHAADRDRRPAPPADRPAVAAGAAQAALGGEPLDQVAERPRLGRFGGGEELGDRRSVIAGSARATRPASRPSA